MNMTTKQAFCTSSEKYKDRPESCPVDCFVNVMKYPPCSLLYVRSVLYDLSQGRLWRFLIMSSDGSEVPDLPELQAPEVAWHTEVVISEDDED